MFPSKRMGHDHEILHFLFGLFFNNYLREEEKGSFIFTSSDNTNMQNSPNTFNDIGTKSKSLYSMLFQLFKKR